MSGSHSTPAFGLRSWQAILSGVESPELVEGLVLVVFNRASLMSMPEIFPTIPCPERVSDSAWVYILQSADGSHYIGQTHDLHERQRKHRLGLDSKHTHGHGAPRLVTAKNLSR